MTIHDLELEINQFFLDSEKEVDEKGVRQQGVYPNAVLLTEQQYKDFIKEILNVDDEIDIPSGIFISSICGLKAIISEENLDKPKVIRM